MRPGAYWKIVLALVILALASGFMGGVLSLQLYKRQLLSSPGPAPVTNNLPERLAAQLKLTPEQRVQARSILERGQAEIRSVSSNAVLGVMEARQRMEADLHPLLTPEQQRRLEKMKERRDKARERLFRGERAWPAPKEPAGQKPRPERQPQKDGV
jgi:hypothetical protein